MIILLKPDASKEEIATVSQKLEEFGLKVSQSTGLTCTILEGIGDDVGVDTRDFEQLPGVRKVLHVGTPYKLASRESNLQDTILQIGNVQIGGDELVLIAGPCSIESRYQINTIADIVARHGARILRGGAFKPRTSPYSFQGLGERGLKLLREAADAHHLLAITEVMDASQLELAIQYVDILQIGARNMQNFSLLRFVGRSRKPVLLKRGFAATIEEWLLSAEYILKEGNDKVILCERGIRHYTDHTRFILDIGAIPAIKELSHLPILVDPSHAAGFRGKVTPLALAAISAGADGLIVEVHHQPYQAKSDGAQSLLPEQFGHLADKVREMSGVVGRRFNR